jgi:hypothetical protein
VLSVISEWLLLVSISHQPAVLYSQNKSATSNQPAVLFSQNKAAPAISHQPNEQAVVFAKEKHKSNGKGIIYVHFLAFHNLFACTWLPPVSMASFSCRKIPDFTMLLRLCTLQFRQK